MKKALTNGGIVKSRFYILLVVFFASTMIVSDIQAQVVAYRVNAGGRVTATGDNSYPAWSEDQQLATDPAPIQSARNGIPSPYVNEEVAGDQTAGKNQDINLTGILEPGGIVNDLFQTQRWDVAPPDDNLVYSFPIVTGRTYQVNLYFAEIFGEGQGTRQFDISINGELIQDNFDILNVTGNQEKVAFVLQEEVIAEGQTLDIEFGNETELPALISAIEIVDLTSTNEAPVVTVPERQKNLEEETVSLQIEATDPDGDGLSYTAEGLPGGLTLDSTTGLITGTLEEGVQGLFDVVLTVFDDGSPSAGTIVSFQWSVANDPLAINPLSDLVVEVGAETEVITLVDVFEDPNDLELTYSISNNTDESLVSANINNEGDGIVLNYSNSNTGIAEITVRATNTVDAFGEDTFTVELITSAVPSAVVQITPNDGLGGSTFNGSSILVENTSLGNITIRSVTLNLANTLFPDLVFDPTGVAGDSGAKCLTADLNAEETGFNAPENPCVDPFSIPEDGGFVEMVANFNDFDAGETVGMSVDVDPTSIKGNPGVGDAGSIGGVEMVGTTVTIEFSNEETITNDVFYLPGSGGGGQAVVKNQEEVQLATPAVAPAISIQGTEESEITVSEIAQVIEVTGPANASVTLLQVDGRLNLEGTPNGGFEIEPFEANEAIGVIETYTATLDGAGAASIPVNLKRSFFDGSFSGGINHFIAVVEDEFAGRTSNRVIASLEELAFANFNEGWNLIGLSYTVESGNYLDLYADVSPDPDFPPFGWDGSGYFQLTDLGNGAAYWINVANSGSVAIFGEDIDELAVVLEEGWNMIAGPSCDVAIADIQDPSNVIVDGTLFEYNDGYLNATSVQPNKGYWINASGDGTITLSCAVPQDVVGGKHNLVANDKEHFGTIRIGDQEGNEQILYFGSELEGSAKDQSYIMPPYGPNGFDARFSDGTRLAESSEALISLRSDAFPVELRLDEAPSAIVGPFIVEALAGHDVVGTYNLVEGEGVFIANADVTALRLSTSIDDAQTLPEQFTLNGNYPNPFNPTTNIVFDLPDNAVMRVEVYDLLGRRVMDLSGLEMEAGAGRQIQLDASSLASGSYIYRVHATMDAGSLIQTGRMTLLK